jgi:hypothetical protein
VIAKPVLLLDVDGVLNAFPPGYEERMVRLSGVGFHPTQTTLPFMRWAWEKFTVFWLTAWFGSANEIADWAKLPRRPFLGDPKDFGDYKLKAVSEKFHEFPGKVVWIEDGIGEAAEAWVKERKNILYVETDPFVGVTEDHIKTMTAFVEGR